MNLIYVIFSYKSNYAKKICKVLNIRSLFITLLETSDHTFSTCVLISENAVLKIRITTYEQDFMKILYEQLNFNYLLL